MRAYTYSYRSSYHAHIVTHVVTHIVTRIVTRIATHIVTHIVAEGVAFRSHHRLSIVRPLQGRPCMREVICKGKRNEESHT